MADSLNGIFISEILADNAGGAAIDTDGDGNTNKADEYIELQNASGGTVSLDGYELWSDQNGLLYSFADGGTIAPGENATVVGNYAPGDGGGFFDAGLAENGNFLQDGEGQRFDTIYLVDTNTGEFIALSYGQPLRPPNPPADFPGTTQVGAGESLNSNAPNGTAFARDANGDFEETTPTPNQPDTFCFLSGTLIETQNGPRAIQELRPGCRVLTRDAGYVPIRAIGRFTPKARDLWHNRGLLPVRIPAGTFGAHGALCLSGAHRILINAPVAELLFGEREVLVSARQCIGWQGVHVSSLGTLPGYYHLILARHEIVKANGCWSESMFKARNTTLESRSDTVWETAPRHALHEVHHTQTARMMLKRTEARVLLSALCGAPQSLAQSHLRAA